MNWKRNSTLTICLGAGLLLAIILVCFLLWNRTHEAPVEQMNHLAHPGNAGGPPRTPPPQQARSQQQAPQQQGDKPALVLFHANGCHHCTTFKPVWEELKKVVPPQACDLIDFEASTARQEVASQGIAGFPTIRLYLDGFPSQNFKEYQGPRKLENIIMFIKSNGEQM